jgi:hypothetical protein
MRPNLRLRQLLSGMPGIVWPCTANLQNKIHMAIKKVNKNGQKKMFENMVL